MFPVVARANRNRLPLYWAAHDLVDYLEKISGVRPVLAAEPQPDTIPVRICVLEDDASLTSQPYAKRVSIPGYSLRFAQSWFAAQQAMKRFICGLAATTYSRPTRGRNERPRVGGGND